MCVEAPYLYVRDLITLLHKILPVSGSLASNDLEMFLNRYPTYRKVLKTIISVLVNETSTGNAGSVVYLYSTIDEKFDLMQHDLSLFAALLKCI